jgi:hypothetical protein
LRIVVPDVETYDAVYQRLGDCDGEDKVPTALPTGYVQIKQAK